MASQPPDTGRDRNQVRPLRSTVSSVRGKANRHRSTGVFGSHFVLDCGGSRKQATRFQDLLQQPSHAYLNGRANAESACVTSNRKSPLVSMATSLSILISDTSGCVIPKTLIAPVSGQPWKDFRFESPHVYHYSLPLLDLCCIFDYGLPDISRSIRSNNRLGKPNHGDNQMKKNDRMRTSRHPSMGAKPENT